VNELLAIIVVVAILVLIMYLANDDDTITTKEHNRIVGQLTCEIARLKADKAIYERIHK